MNEKLVRENGQLRDLGTGMVVACDGFHWAIRWPNFSWASLVLASLVARFFGSGTI